MKRKGWFAAVVAVCVGLLSFAGSAAAQETRGVLEVPLDHAQPDGPKLNLSYVHYTRDADRRRGTIVFFAGGPGEAAVRSADEIAGLVGELRNTYEVVVFDQRGAGRSSPLRCPDLGEPNAETQAAARAITECGTRLGDERRFFSTYETALDV